MAIDIGSESTYLERLSQVKDDVQPLASEIRGKGIGAFLEVRGPAGNVELSEDSDCIWVEFWRPDTEEREKSSTFEGYPEAIEAVLNWCAA